MPNASPSELINALNAKANALEDANGCITGEAQQEKRQHTDNLDEIADITPALNRVNQGIQKVYTANEASDLETKSDALSLLAGTCATNPTDACRNQVIADSRTLISIIKASTVT